MNHSLSLSHILLVWCVTNTKLYYSFGHFSTSSYVGPWRTKRKKENSCWLCQHWKESLSLINLLSAHAYKTCHFLWLKKHYFPLASNTHNFGYREKKFSLVLFCSLSLRNLKLCLHFFEIKEKKRHYSRGLFLNLCEGSASNTKTFAIV